MRLPITADQFDHIIRTFADQFEHEAFRLELQATYVESDEDRTVARFLAGEPDDPTESPGLKAWFEQIAIATSAGKRVVRVRVQEEPPTPYQKWERWLGAWNAAAGEEILYLSRSRAFEIGLLPHAGTSDWWLFDGQILLLMHFDGVGVRCNHELTDAPIKLKQVRAWRDLAVRHGAPDDPQGVSRTDVRSNSDGAG